MFNLKRNTWKKGSALVLALTLGAALAGCGSNKAAEDTAAAAGEGKKAETADKTLTVYTAGPEGLANDLIKDFESQTGIKVETFQGTTGKILARLEAKNADKLNKDWSDPEGNYFSTSASALGIAYNTKLVTTPPTSWSDLAKPDYKNQVNIPDPSLSGSALDFITGYLSDKGEGGWSLFESYKANGVAMAGANQEALDPVITGAKSMVAGAVDYMTYKAKTKGEPIDIVYPQEGTVVSPRPAAILKSAKHEENAKAFIDYLLSDAAQKLVSDAALLPGRTDIKAENRANLDEIPLLKTDWGWMGEHGTEVTERFTKLLK